jgi:hypothetical protein
VVWPSHHRLAQNYYDLEKINVEWSSALSRRDQNYYDLEKINVGWSGPLTIKMPIIITTS